LDTDDGLMEVDGPNDEIDANIKSKPVGPSQNTKVRHITAFVFPSIISFVFSLLTSVSDFSSYQHLQGSSSALKEGEA
jgi:hypothetical protein